MDNNKQINVFILKRWEDYYCFGKFIPWPVTALLILPLHLQIEHRQHHHDL